MENVIFDSYILFILLFISSVWGIVCIPAIGTPPNDPIGTEKGIYPDGLTDYYWSNENTNYDIVKSMLDLSITALTGTKSVKDAWDAIFKHFNEKKIGKSVGYKANEKIAVKMNLNTNTDYTEKHWREKSENIEIEIIDVAGVTNFYEMNENKSIKQMKQNEMEEKKLEKIKIVGNSIEFGNIPKKSEITVNCNEKIEVKNIPKQNEEVVKIEEVETEGVKQDKEKIEVKNIPKQNEEVVKIEEVETEGVKQDKEKIEVGEVPKQQVKSNRFVVFLKYMYATSADGSDRNKDLKPLIGLRGLCSLFIVVGHSFDFFLSDNIGEYPNFGYVPIDYLSAVTLFLLLSGISLARFYSRANKLNNLNGIWNFYKARMARLFPTYYFSLMIDLFPLAALFHYNGPSYSNWMSVALTPGFLQSFTGTCDWNGPLWTVSVFVQGYFIYPLLQWVIKKIPTWLLVCLAFALYAVMFFITLCLNSAIIFTFLLDRLLLWHLQWYRIGHFIIGAVLGDLIERRLAASRLAATRLDTSMEYKSYKGNGYESRNRGNRCQGGGIVAGVVTDMLSVFFFVSNALCMSIGYLLGPRGPTLRFVYMVDAEFGQVPLFCLWLYCMVICDSRWCLTRWVLSLRPLLWLGDVSYVLYCVHFPLYYYYTCLVRNEYYPMPANRRLYGLEYYHFPIALVFFIVFSFLVHKCFENPIRRFITRKKKQKK